MFVDAGAAVFIGEPPEGATLRRSADPGERALFEFLTHGKSSIVVINWLDSLDLARTADVVIEDGLPQSQLEDLLEIGLVVVSLSPFGRSGPLARRWASELTIQAESGCLATRGDKSGMPFQAGGHIIEWVTGSYAAVAALAALQREVGEHIDVSMLEVAALTGTNFYSFSHELAGRPQIETPVRVIEAPEIHASSDGWVGFTTNSAQQFQDFLVMIGRPDLLSDAELATAAGRQARLRRISQAGSRLDDEADYGRDRCGGVCPAHTSRPGSERRNRCRVPPILERHARTISGRFLDAAATVAPR